MEYLMNKKNCTGCSACASTCPKQCITMVTDSEGFWYPKIDQLKCIDCSYCQKICPVLNQVVSHSVPHAFAAFCKDETIRKCSSSGGVFSILAKRVIDNGGIVFGACFDKHFSVEHGFTETKEKLDLFRGSKYVQSKINNAYLQAKTFLEHGRLVYFSGTPCQIGGLKAFLRKDYNNLICQDLICHGVPSPKAWKEYIAFREHVAGTSVKSVNFRDKRDGWQKYSVSIRFQNGQEYHEPLDNDSYLKVFLNNIDLRPSCYHCPFKGLSRESDITLADFWGIEKIFPKLCDNKGVSLLLVHTEKGRSLLKETANSLFLKPFDCSIVSVLNPSVCQSAPLNKNRNNFFKYLRKKDFDDLAKQYASKSKKFNVLVFLKSILRLLGLYRPAKKCYHLFFYYFHKKFSKLN